MIFGAAGLVLVGIMARRWWLKRLDEKKEEERRQRLERTRKERRQRARAGEDYSEAQLCIVCKENPKEVILLPCGHVCVCEDCNEDISNLCPVCRTEIQSRNPAYIT